MAQVTRTGTTPSQQAAALATAAENEKTVIASVCLSTVTGEELLTVQAHDLDPYVTVTIGQHSVDLTRDQAGRAGDALRACAVTAIDTEFGDVDDAP